MNVLTALRHLSNLTINEATLVNYIMQYPEKVINMHPKELSQNAYVSVSTIYRLINKLDLSGMNELKLE
ncbi:MAG: MurR/RpiR family transcriptional regulator, partial [Bacillus sp. (in: firmicutes)]